MIPTLCPPQLCYYGNEVAAIERTYREASDAGKSGFVQQLSRTYAPPTPWEYVIAPQFNQEGQEDQASQVQVVGTANINLAPILIGAIRPEAELVKQIDEYSKLAYGWDGESAAKPSRDAIDDAIRFIQAAGYLANDLEPTLHADGSIILEVGDGEEGSLRFKGDGSVIYAIGDAPPGKVRFDGFALPAGVQAALESI